MTSVIKIYFLRIKNKSKKKNDLVIFLSGSGNSENIINGIKLSLKNNLKVFSILGFDGGKAKKLSQNFFHIEINDMQYSRMLKI